MKIEIKNRFTGEVIFSHEQENNSFRISVELAIKSSADLRSADLSSADLRSADLRYANLRSADLSSANLRSADLSSASLICTGDMKFIFTLQIDKWLIGFTKDILQIGCQRHSIEDWRNLSDETINDMASGALAWWKRWKGPLFTIIDERLKDL
jgi:uncharacterized protein YjbI with pentapeptide repeats